MFIIFGDDYMIVSKDQKVVSDRKHVPSWLPALQQEIGWIVSKGNLTPFPIKVTPTTVSQWLESAKVVVDIVAVTGFVCTSYQPEKARCGEKRGSRNSKPHQTCKARYFLQPLKKLQTANSPFKDKQNRIRAIKCLSRLEGQLHLWKDACPIAGTGLVPFWKYLFLLVIFRGVFGWLLGYVVCVFFATRYDVIKKQ